MGPFSVAQPDPTRLSASECSDYMALYKLNYLLTYLLTYPTPEIQVVNVY